MRGIVLAGLLVACACSDRIAPPGLEIERLLRDQSAAWNRGDLEAFCSVYADDASFLSPSGLTKGRQAVLDRYRKKYVDKVGMGSLSLDVDEVRSVEAAGASVVAHWTLTWPDKPKAEGLTLLVLTRTPHGWRIIQDASM
jgi:uncharacterized protein (TIGR02246 family)